MWVPRFRGYNNDVKKEQKNNECDDELYYISPRSAHRTNTNEQTHYNVTHTYEHVANRLQAIQCQ